MALLTTSLGDDLEELFPDEPVPERPNKYHGSSGTWVTWTREERELARSLETEDDQNLSLHLYCTHKLRAEIERQEAIEEAAVNAGLTAKELRAKKRRRKNATGPRKDAVWRPLPLWTSWPMETKEVPLPELVDVSLRRLPRDVNLDKAKLVTRDLKEEICASVMRTARAMKEQNSRKGPPTALSEGGQNGNAHAPNATTIPPSADLPSVTPKNALPILEDDLCLERLNEPISDVVSHVNTILDAWIQQRKAIATYLSLAKSQWQDIVCCLDQTDIEEDVKERIRNRCTNLLSHEPG